MIVRLMTEHPATVGETYGEHFVQASSFALHLFLAALACAVHAVLPLLFVKTGSRKIEALYVRMVMHRDRRTALARMDAGAVPAAGPGHA
ncbi:MAG: DUF6356 family protein [Rhodospirillaceae bacterium]